MAHRALIAYRGNCVIHVGEWSGLTGTRSFENAVSTRWNLGLCEVANDVVAKEPTDSKVNDQGTGMVVNADKKTLSRRPAETDALSHATDSACPRPWG